MENNFVLEGPNFGRLVQTYGWQFGDRNFETVQTLAGWKRQDSPIWMENFFVRRGLILCDKLEFVLANRWTAKTAQLERRLASDSK